MNRYVCCYILILLWSCAEKRPAPKQIITQPKSHQTLRQELVAVTHLQAYGDFDGDGRKDTVRSHLKLPDALHELDSVPKFDDTVNEDALVSYYGNVEAYILLSGHPKDTLFIGTGSGPFCLFTIGDTAIVYCEQVPDFSLLNHFEIQYYRKGAWQQLANVKIRESAFYTTHTTKSGQPFTDIPDYLEKHDGQWVYRDICSRDSSDAWYPLKQLLYPPKRALNHARHSTILP